ncbi:PhoH Phosphate starvation-inducible protein PhoH, predicted ATPase [uncultured Caudovirales phage]|jgi:phosphate starvation-inducible PhoH-like protein|uniref:PhoH Phosphate starvation-inducible protein PhoH, predicted ATPase n=1 Tax=uncultured Caudovirales phage TaxID=2100421 RepID=A0A6J5M008_9CAUD|nr:PhoH Phosphate starvation-inducible protein PhoH, predicted ATPase [uncultured Caudovirales phage]
MKEPNRVRKNDIKSINALQLNEEQKEAKRLIIENQIIIVTGRAGSGKSLVCAQSALDFLKKKQINCIYNTRAAIEVGKSLGFLPGSLNDKFDPYMEALLENLIKCCSDKNEVTKLIEEEKVKALPIQFIRGKTVDDILIVEEAQNLTKAEMLAILTRLGKTGKIVINGDNEQTDIKTPTGEINGLSYVIELSKKIEEIKWIKLKENHRSDLVGKILDHEYGK